jgi:RimJ/RimL family protein N-acetyltransferase
MNNSFKLRVVEAKDVDVLFSWTNDPDVRKNSFNQEKITYEVHCNWFRKKIADPNVIMLIAEIDEIPAGQIRLEGTVNEEWGINFSIANEFRGKGIGTRVLKEAGEYISRTKGPSCLIGKVKAQNIASQKAFYYSGFLLRKTEEDVLTFFKRINPE